MEKIKHSSPFRPSAKVIKKVTEDEGPQFVVLGGCNKQRERENEINANGIKCCLTLRGEALT